MKKLLIFAVGTLLTMTACSEKTTERIEIIKRAPAVVVPEKKVEVIINSKSVPAPIIINHESKTSTTTHTDDTGTIKTETHTESVH